MALGNKAFVKAHLSLSFQQIAVRLLMICLQLGWLAIYRKHTLQLCPTTPPRRKTTLTFPPFTVPLKAYLLMRARKNSIKRRLVSVLAYMHRHRHELTRADPPSLAEAEAKPKLGQQWKLQLQSQFDGALKLNNSRVVPSVGKGQSRVALVLAGASKHTTHFLVAVSVTRCVCASVSAFACACVCASKYLSWIINSAELKIL